MRYHLPGPEHEQPRSVAGIARVGAATGPTGHEPEPAAAPGGVLVRTVTLGPGESAAHLRRWVSGSPDAHALPAPDGVIARERSRPDRSVPGATRRQRLAVREGAGGAVAVHWSAPEPVEPVADASWRRVLARLGGDAGSRGAGGWAA